MSIGARFSNPIYVGYTSDPFLSQEPLQKEFLEFPVLHNLKTLLMEECGVRTSFLVLTSILRSTPNVEKLGLHQCFVRCIYHCTCP
jgi:hypothetical protein